MKTISKRWIKNAVAIVVMQALCGSMFFTMSYAKSHAQASDMLALHPYCYPYSHQ